MQVLASLLRRRPSLLQSAASGNIASGWNSGGRPPGRGDLPGMGVMINRKRREALETGLAEPSARAAGIRLLDGEELQSQRRAGGFTLQDKIFLVEPTPKMLFGAKVSFFFSAWSRDLDAAFSILTLSSRAIQKKYFQDIFIIKHLLICCRFDQEKEDGDKIKV